MGGVAAFAGAKALGPRLGKYSKDGSANTLPGHHIPMALLGTFILLFGWFGFNAASTLAATDVQFAVVATNTAIAAAFGATTGMLWIMMRQGKPDPGMMANGMLAGLVAITAPCAFVTPLAAAVIGTLAAVIVIESILFIDLRLKVDDPVGAISVHGVGGAFGVLCVGIFANGTYGAGWNLTASGPAAEAAGITGILTDFDLGLRQLASQAAGIGTILLMGVVAFGWFKLSNKISPIRSTEQDELVGLDLPEMGAMAYPEFLQQEVLVPHAGGSRTHDEPYEPGKEPYRTGV
jgi:Amt family ammonium transporter